MVWRSRLFGESLFNVSANVFSLISVAVPWTETYLPGVLTGLYTLRTLLSQEFVVSKVLSAFWGSCWLLIAFVVPETVTLSLLILRISSNLVIRFWLILCKKESIAGKSYIPCLTPVNCVWKFPGWIVCVTSWIIYGPLNIGTCLKLKYIVGCNKALPNDTTVHL